MTKKYILEITYVSGTMKRINYSTAENAKKAYHKICKQFPGWIKYYTIYDPDKKIVESRFSDDYSVVSEKAQFPRKIVYRCKFTDPLGREHEKLEVYVAGTQEDYDNVVKALSIPDVEIIMR